MKYVIEIDNDDDPSSPMTVIYRQNGIDINTIKFYDSSYGFSREKLNSLFELAKVHADTETWFRLNISYSFQFDPLVKATYIESHGDYNKKKIK